MAFVKSAKALARMYPPYLCLATEINFLALQRLNEYLHFASLYKEAYQAVKQVSPKTKVFVSFQWEWVRILDDREPHKIKELGLVRRNGQKKPGYTDFKNLHDSSK